jgi:hypothetical protein
MKAEITTREFAILMEIYSNRTLTFKNLKGRFWHDKSDQAASKVLVDLVHRRLLYQEKPDPSHHTRYFVTFHGLTVAKNIQAQLGIAREWKFKIGSYPISESEHDHRVYEIQTILRRDPTVLLSEWETDYEMKSRFGAAFYRRVPDGKFVASITGVGQDIGFLLEYEHAAYPRRRVEFSGSLWLDEPWGAFHKLVVVAKPARVDDFRNRLLDFYENRYPNPYELSRDQLGRRFSFVCWDDLQARGFRNAPWKRLDGQAPKFFTP